MASSPRPPGIPPAWFVHVAWRIHRGLHRLSRGGYLWPPGGKRGWGALRLTTVGRTTGADRAVIIAYLDDGPDLVAVAMNGWDEGQPSWWLNLEAHPDATVTLAGGEQRLVHARAAVGDEHDRIWARWVALDPQMDGWAASRRTPTPVIVLEPRR